MQELEQTLNQTLTRIPLSHEQKDRMKGRIMTEESNLKTALSRWATQNDIRPAAFAKRMGYTPSYGWSLLRGQAGVTPEAFGRFVLAYGTEAASQVLALANYPTETLPAPHGAQTVPVVSIPVPGTLGA